MKTVVANIKILNFPKTANKFLVSLNNIIQPNCLTFIVKIQTECDIVFIQVILLALSVKLSPEAKPAYFDCVGENSDQ